MISSHNGKQIPHEVLIGIAMDALQELKSRGDRIAKMALFVILLASIEAREKQEAKTEQSAESPADPVKPSARPSNYDYCKRGSLN